MGEDSFSGFPKDGLQFLRDLAEHNEPDWYRANKARFEAGLLDPAKAFVIAMGDAFDRFAPDVQAEPRVNGSIFRQNRDTRFSQDKTPYKTHLDLWFWSGDGRGWDNPGFFFRLLPDRLTLGTGLHKLDAKLLPVYRAAVVEPKLGHDLDAAVAAVTSAGYTLGGQHYKKVPAGFDAEHKRADLLRHNGLTATWEGDVPANVHEASFVATCATHFEKMAPLHRWLLQAFA